MGLQPCLSTTTPRDSVAPVVAVVEVLAAAAVAAAAEWFLAVVAVLRVSVALAGVSQGVNQALQDAG